jgi:hypothetical protein
VQRIVTPDSRALPLTVRDGKVGKAVFEQTDLAGIYRLAEGDGAEAVKAAPPVAAVNVPPEESSLVRIEPTEVRALLPGIAVSFLSSDGGVSQVAAEGENSSAASGFPLAVLAMLLLVGEVVIAWSMSRPQAAAQKNGAAGKVAA